MAAASPSDTSENDRELPTPEERLTDFYAEFDDLAYLPLTDEPGTSLRREYVHEEWREWESEPITETEDKVTGQERVAVEAVTWGEAVETILENYEDTRKTTVNLECGQPSDPEYAEWSVDAETRWMPSYQRKYYAQLEAWIRELTGGERPSGGETEGSFDDPHVVLLTRSASSKPDGERLSPAVHWNSIGDCWSGSGGSVYDTLRNVLRSKGYEIGTDWQYERRLEPHTGKRGDSRNVNQCYGHEHVVVVVDGPVEESDFAPVLEKHVEECEYAGAEAHQVGKAVEVFKPEELEKNVARYIAAYAGIEPTGLLERPTDYIAWSALMDATNTRTKSRSDAAKHAAKADACRQRAESARSDQSADHGTEVVRSTRRGYDFECKHCGSPHDIDQSPETLTAARLDSEAVAADGGIDRSEDLRDRWQDARAASAAGQTPTQRRRRQQIQQFIEGHPRGERASPQEIIGHLGLPPKCVDLVKEVIADIDPVESVSFERVPEWRVVSVEIGEEQYPASAGNGIEMVEIQEESQWLPPHPGGRVCPRCEGDSILSAREWEAVYKESVSSAYCCEDCGTELGPMDGPEKPPPLRE